LIPEQPTDEAATANADLLALADAAGVHAHWTDGDRSSMPSSRTRCARC